MICMLYALTQMYIRAYERQKSSAVCHIAFTPFANPVEHVRKHHTSGHSLEHTQPTAALTIHPHTHRDHTQGLLDRNSRSYSPSVEGEWCMNGDFKQHYVLIHRKITHTQAPSTCKQVLPRLTLFISQPQVHTP